MRARRFLLDGLALCAVPLFFICLGLSGLINTDGAALYSGLLHGAKPPIVTGAPTIDPNYGFTSQALGRRAALDLLEGKVPVWNHYEGLGAPLLGGMQSAALFPFTLLLAWPGGQVIEQALLQILAGLGAYLLMRRMGVGAAVAVTCGILFSLNGVFAWLRNAIFNPVAFLPWILLAIEGLYRAARARRPFIDRVPTVLMGAVMAALSVYAGFPEVVFFYALMLFGWVALRLAACRGREGLVFLLDLALLGAIAVLLSLPALLAFAAYLPDAALGSHVEAGFHGAVLPPSGLLQYALPYVYGAIFAAPSVLVFNLWGNIGGYVGLVPLYLALVALLLPRRRGVKLFLWGWIALALAVTHGLPVIYDAFMLIPLASTAAAFRYLNAGWIFAFVILSGLALAQIATGDRVQVRRALWGALAILLVLLAAAAGAAWPMLTLTVSGPSGVRTALIASVVAAAALVAAFVFAARQTLPSATVALLGALAIGEASVNFGVPYLSYSRGGQLDLEAVAFMKERIGFGRVLATDGGQLAPNYGSYFGLAALNWNNLPAPKASVDYVRGELDPFTTDGPFFLPEGINLSEAQRRERFALMSQRIDRYAKAGVKYVLARPGANAHLASIGRDFTPLPLQAGDRALVRAHAPVLGGSSVSQLAVLIGTYDRTADGMLKARVCQNGMCAEGSAALASAGDNAPLAIALSPPLTLSGEALIEVELTKDGGTKPVAVWLAAVDRSSNAATASVVEPAGRETLAPDIRLGTEFAPGTTLVHRAKGFDIYEIAAARPYFEAPGCAVAATDRDVAKVECPAPSRLTRLELAMPGWKVRVNGAAGALTTVDGVFQQVEVPAGTSTVLFRYRPGFLSQALIIALVTLFAVVVTAGALVARRFFRESEA